MDGPLHITSDYSFYFQIIPCIRGNAACIVGTVPVSEGLDEVFDFVEHSSENS